MDDTAHTRKKAKVGNDPTTAPLGPFNYSAAQRADLRASFISAKPYPHASIPSLGDDTFMRAVRDEIVTNLRADYKETDIFKVLQTKDLGNLQNTDESLKTLLQLRDTIYSPEFRSFIRDVTECPPLTEQVDCSCSIYPEGGHLLCHDDVIGSRCVSYIIYLTDPDSEWKESDGGALELYSVGNDNQPECHPSERIGPKWNQMVFFRTEPDVSFHSVEEVRTAENHRLSISGWFHTSQEHVRTSRSSLSQLQNSTTAPLATFNFPPEEHGDALPEEDVEYLKQWIHTIYLDSANIEEIYQTFRKEGSIQLRDFLNGGTLERITSLLEAADNEAVDSGSLPGWSVVGPPHKQRYLRVNGSGDDGDSAIQQMGTVLSQIEQELFQSPSFRRLLHQLTGVDTLTGHSEVRCFRPGSDYTIAVYNQTKRDTLDAILCFVKSPDETVQSQWDCGEVGGFEAYLLADTREQEAADVYRADDEDSGVLSVNPAHNTLNLVLADQGLIKFVKYVSAAAPGCRWDISAEYVDADDPERKSEAESEESRGETSPDEQSDS